LARRFGRDASVIGKRIELNQIPLTVIGVNPPGFTGMEPGQSPDIFVPFRMQPIILPSRWVKTGNLLDNPDYWWVLIAGRLRPGVSDAQAQASFDVVLQQAVRASLPERVDRDMPRMRLLPGAKGLDDLRSEFGRPMFVLAPLVGVVLLIACVNLANLLLARAAARRREISVRIALVAGRWRIVRQMLTEGLLLAALGGAAGLLLGYWARDAIPGLLATSWRDSPFQAHFDSRVLLLSIAVTIFTGILFSLVPAWQSTRVEVNAVLKDGGRNATGLSRLLVGKALVVVQVSLSVLLLVGAGLFLRTLVNLKSASLGFEPDRILLFTIDPPRVRYSGNARPVLFEKLVEQIDAIPGVQSASLSSTVLVARSSSTTNVIPSRRAQRPGDADRAWVNEVGLRFFETMGIPILFGRPLGPQDQRNALRVAVVNQQFVRKFYPNENPLGKTFVNNEEVYQIAGICGDARYSRVNDPVPPTFYRPFTQAKDLGGMTFEVKTALSDAVIMKSIRDVVRSIDKDLPVFDVRTQRGQIDATLSSQRMFAVLTTAFGLLALVLACVGIYGVMANAVARRTNEIGIRMALGARNGQVLGMVLREAVILTTIGIVLGILAATGLTRYIRTMLYGLEPSDPATLASAVVFMLTVSLLASWWPARRASRVDPMVALRHD
jgi:predicted permease